MLELLAFLFQEEELSFCLGELLLEGGRGGGEDTVGGEVAGLFGTVGGLFELFVVVFSFGESGVDALEVSFDGSVVVYN